MHIPNMYGFILFTTNHKHLFFLNILKHMLQNKNEFSLKSIQIDNVHEFLCLKSFLNENGIQYHLTRPCTHEQNGSIECKHKHIVYVGLSLLTSASLHMSFWGETFALVVSIINVLPSKVLNHDIPYNLIFHKSLE